MTLSLDKQRLRFYIWVGVAYTGIWLFADLVGHPESFLLWWRNEIWRGLYFVAVNYFFYEYTLPRLAWKRFFRSVLLVALQFFLYSVGAYAWRRLGIELHIHTSFITYTSSTSGSGELFGASVFSAIFFGIIRHAYNHRALKRAAQQLRIEKQEAELQYLKSQTNPHFLFNTLNNIYALARDKSELAPESILRLSKILRFMLYETAGDYISLEQEMRIINDYLALEKLRYDESLRVSFDHTVENPLQPVPPLLLIPLVENAFKHGAAETRNQPYVDIRLSVHQRRLEFLVTNSTEADASAASVKENIGLSNLRRQLELLYTDFSLTVNQGASEFTAHLKIDLASHV